MDKRLAWIAWIALNMGIGVSAAADPYPTKPIKLVVPWPPGQSTDVVSRIVTEKMAESLGQPRVVDNRPGAGGTIGTEVAAKAAADGYTLLAASSGPISISPYIQKVSYEPLKDFEPVCRLTANPYVLVVHPSMPVSNAAEFIKVARASPGRYTYASSGIGSTAHLVTAAFNAEAGIEAVHVPYKGSAPAVIDLIAGHVTYTFETLSAVLAHAQGGKLKALAVTSDKPFFALPDLPTLASVLNQPGFDLRGWQGLMVPAGTPRALRMRLAEECRKAIEAKATSEQLLSSGVEPGLLMPDEFGRFLEDQGRRYSAIARQAGLKPE
jgi:tripartite-type tricarboxylate transporter receptor subunit TctC